MIWDTVLSEPEEEQVLGTHRSPTSPQAPDPRDYCGGHAGSRAAAAAPPQRPQIGPLGPSRQASGGRASHRESANARDKATCLYKSRDHLSHCFRP